MKGLGTYWIIGCLLCGASIGLHETRCPADAIPSAMEFLVGVAVWPLGISWAMMNSKLRACERVPNITQ